MAYHGKGVVCIIPYSMPPCGKEKHKPQCKTRAGDPVHEAGVKAPTTNFMTLEVACRAILPHPTDTYLDLPSDWPSHGHQRPRKATVTVKKSASYQCTLHDEQPSGHGAMVCQIVKAKQNLAGEGTR